MHKKYLHLRKFSIGKQAPWTLENVRDGLEYYRKIHGRFPSSIEEDQYEYLPSSRSIQRSLGGLTRVRTMLGLSCPAHFNTGKDRSELVKKLYKNALDYEEAFYNFLISVIPEIHVHEQKRLRPGNVSADFFVYTTPNAGVALDLFYARGKQSLQNNINIKAKRYAKIPFPVYFICVQNPEINQEIIDGAVQNKKNPLPENIRVVSEERFKKKVKNILRLIG